MHIRTLPEEKCIALLSRVHLGHLACAKDGQPYVTPVYFAYDGGYLYGAAAQGRKIDWMRQNARVCVAFEDMLATHEWEWASVVVTGFYEELLDSPEFRASRAFAHDLLKRNSTWWEPSHVRAGLSAPRDSADLVLFRITPAEISGRCAVRRAGSS